MQFQMANDITEFVRWKSSICGNSKIVKPDLRFFVAGADMNVRGLVPFIGIEESPVRTPA